MRKIGILAPRESFSDAVMEYINNKKDPEIKAELVVTGETRIFEPTPYRVIIDRISYYVDYFKTYLVNSALSGAYIINNPFKNSMNDRFFSYSMAKKIKVAVPRTVVLPSHEYHAALGDEDLRNLKYPLDWEGICDYVGFPAILKPYDGYGFRDVYKVNNLQELIKVYDGTGKQVLIMQEFIDYEFLIRIYVVGKDQILPLKYNPINKEYSMDPKLPETKHGEWIAQTALSINNEMGFDFYSIEFALKDGIPYAVNFLNPIPYCRQESLPPRFFQWVVEHLGNLAIEKAKGNATTPCKVLPEKTVGR